MPLTHNQQGQKGDEIEDCPECFEDLNLDVTDGGEGLFWHWEEFIG